MTRNKMLSVGNSILLQESCQQSSEEELDNNSRLDHCSSLFPSAQSTITTSPIGPHPENILIGQRLKASRQ